MVIRYAVPAINGILTMGLPGHRRTSSHKRRRAAHFSLGKKQLALCQKCKKAVMPHHACAFCGTYAGRQVLKVKAAVKATKASSKKEKEHDEHAGHNH